MTAKPGVRPSAAYHPSFSMGMLVFFIFPSINLVIKAWGYQAFSLPGLAIGLTLALVALGLAAVIDYLMFRLGLPEPIRSGVWFSVTLGPMAVLATINEGGSQMLAQFLGVFGALAGFLTGYLLDHKRSK